MKICHIITRLIIGGAQENTLSTVLGLRQKPDCTVDLVVGPEEGPEGTLIAEARRQGVNVIVVPSLRRAINPFYDLPALLALRRLLKRGEYDVVHTHSAKGGILGRWAACMARVPVVVHTVHGPTFHPNLGALTNFVYRAIEKLAAPCTTHFISVADAMTEQYLAAGIGRRERYVTIRSGIDLAAYARATREEDLCKSAGLTPSDRVVGKIARLFEWKGHEYLLAAAPAIVAAVPNVKFLVVGDGNLRAQLEAKATQLGVRDRFVFAGLVPPSEIPRYAVLMDVLVHLSLREGLPRAVVQAFAAGKPVVAFDVDGSREVVHDGETGFLIPEQDVPALVSSVIRLLREPALAAKLGEAGQKLVAEQFSKEKMVDDIYNLYLRLLEGRRPVTPRRAREPR